jgi:putative FmdB family regulatory protein
MPLYSYLCGTCGVTTEKWCDMGKAPKQVKCEACEQKADRVYSCNAKIPEPTSDARINRGNG